MYYSLFSLQSNYQLNYNTEAHNRWKIIIKEDSRKIKTMRVNKLMKPVCGSITKTYHIMKLFQIILHHKVFP